MEELVRYVSQVALYDAERSIRLLELQGYILNTKAGYTLTDTGIELLELIRDKYGDRFLAELPRQ